MSKQVEQIADNIRMRLPWFAQNVDAAVARLTEEFPGYYKPEDLQEAVKIVKAEFNIEILRDWSVYGGASPWYSGPKPGDTHWSALKFYLKDTKGWPETTRDSVDKSSTEVVSLLGNPRADSYSCRGLVLGYVQSGKTANMTAVIAKAIDAGYNTVFVLAGLTDSLRNQTQKRLDEDIVQLNPSSWYKLTRQNRLEDDRVISGEFEIPNHTGLMYNENRASLAVLKKNVAPLKKLLKTIRGTAAVELSRLKILIIDDECDHGSVNASAKEHDRTKINGYIRKILGAVPCVSYVGYTATPFANVLIDPHEDDDLYPRDFISALPLPDGYQGAEFYFGADEDDASDESLDRAHSVIKDISSDDEKLLQPSSYKERLQFYPQMPDSLSNAILYFLASCAVRRHRGLEDHMTMLLHTSPFVTLHERVEELVRNWIDKNQKDLKSRTGEIFIRLKRVWEEEFSKSYHDKDNGFIQTSFEEMLEYLTAGDGVLEDLEVIVENGRSDDRIDYTVCSKTHRHKTYIVIGGTVLARGLTLDGLCVSYFLRNSKQYDTLLQMGRWFGYRKGYEDLPRIWMPTGLKESFAQLSKVEIGIRKDIETYIKDGVTPQHFAVRIRTTPGLAVTSRNKMRSAEICDISYWGRILQTIKFDYADKSVLEKNWSAGTELVDALEDLGLRRKDSDRIIYENVSRTKIVSFLTRYRIQNDHADLSNETILDFLKLSDRRLDKWNVSILQPDDNGTECEVALGKHQKLQYFDRSRIQVTKEGVANIKALMSARDVAYDIRDFDNIKGNNRQTLQEERKKLLGDIPALLLYPINPNSKPKNSNSGREELGAAGPVLAVGFIMPGKISQSGSYVRAQLRQLSVDELDEEDREARYEAEAAGVE